MADGDNPGGGPFRGDPGGPFRGPPIPFFPPPFPYPFMPGGGPPGAYMPPPPPGYPPYFPPGAVAGTPLYARQYVPVPVQHHYPRPDLLAIDATYRALGEWPVLQSVRGRGRGKEGMVTTMRTMGRGADCAAAVGACLRWGGEGGSVVVSPCP